MEEIIEKILKKSKLEEAKELLELIQSNKIIINIIYINNNNG